jgi:DNA-binding transcriptional LysR family regulator
MTDIKLKDLRYLVAVADCRHFGRAAESCFVSQPTLSAQLKKLEEYLGVQLIERQPNNVSLTEAGQQIVTRARRILEASDEVVTLARSHRDPLVEGLEARELYVEPFIVAMPDHHKLAKRETVRTEDLHGETLLLLEDGHCLRDQALEVCSRVGVHEKQDFRATSLETLRQMVATGAGLTLLPELASRGAYGNAKGVTIRPFANPAPVRHIGAVWRKTTARRPAIDAVCKLIADHAK